MNIPFFPLVFCSFSVILSVFFLILLFSSVKAVNLPQKIESFTDILHHTAQHQALFNETVRYRSRL